MGDTVPMKRADWHLRANLFVLIYLLAALITGMSSKLSSEDHLSWLTVHLLLLGAITNGILIWSEHFVAALLWSRSQGRLRKLHIVVALNIGILGVLTGVGLNIGWLVIASASVVCAIISVYLWGIHESISQTLNRRYVGLIRYYQCAGVAILVGIVLGSIDAFKSDDDPWQPKLALAHLHVNLLGWVGLSIIGTFITFWPTVLRTPMHASAVKCGVFALPVLVSGVITVMFGSIFEIRELHAVGDLFYLIGLSIVLAPCALALRQRIPDRASSWMMATGVVGMVLVVVLDGLFSLGANSAEDLLKRIEDHSLVIFVVWLLPIFLGSLTYLLPVVLGRGPKVNRELESLINTGWHWRVLLMPLSSILLLFTEFQALGFLFAGLSIGIFLILAFATVVRAQKHSPASNL
jgi:hypothetical protein